MWNSVIVVSVLIEQGEKKPRILNQPLADKRIRIESMYGTVEILSAYFTS